MSWGQHEAPFEACEARAATHLALEQFQARDLTLHRPTTPGQHDPGFDRVVIILESFGKPLPGSHDTLGGTREPRLQLLGLPLAHEVDEVLGEIDRLGHVRMLGAQLVELLGVVLGALLLMLYHQPGRLTSGEEPLRALWAFNTDRKSARFLTEFIGLANHRKSIRGEISAYAERFRAIELAAIEAAVADGRIDLGGLSPAGILVLLSTSSRGLVNEEAIGMSTGHEEVHALVEQLLTRAEGRA